MNTYNIFSKKEPSCILYHAVAESEGHVKELAKESEIPLKGLTISLERTNVKNQLGRDYEPFIKESIIH